MIRKSPSGDLPVNHESAYVDNTAILCGKIIVEENVFIGPYAVICAARRKECPWWPNSVDRLLQESFIVREKGSGTLNAIEQFLEQRSQSMTTTMEMSSNEAIKHAVMAGLGIVSLHTLVIEFKLGRLAVLNVEGFPILKSWYVVHREGKRFFAAAQTFKEFVLNEGSKLVTIPQPDDTDKRKSS